MRFLSLSASGIALLIAAATAGLPSDFSLTSPASVLSSRQITSSQTIHSQTNHSQTNRVNQSYQLTVKTTGRSLNAELKIDGRLVRTLVDPSETIALSSYLSTAGQHTIEIVGTYAPINATAEILLTGPGTQISHQVSGQGTLRQTLQISVR